MIFSKIIDSRRIFVVCMVIFILALSIAVYIRGGKDLKVAIYGAQQTLHKKSPYENPGGRIDPRPLFRYGPGFAIMMYPFLLGSKPYKMAHGDIQIGGIMPSVFAWYFLQLLLLLLIAKIMLKIIPCESRETSIRNLKISFLLALPFIGCELANSQNKIIALFFFKIIKKFYPVKTSLIKKGSRKASP